MFPEMLKKGSRKCESFLVAPSSVLVLCLAASASGTCWAEAAEV